MSPRLEKVVLGRQHLLFFFVINMRNHRQKHCQPLALNGSALGKASPFPVNSDMFRYNEKNYNYGQYSKKTDFLVSELFVFKLGLTYEIDVAANNV